MSSSALRRVGVLVLVPRGSLVTPLVTSLESLHSVTLGVVWVVPLGVVRVEVATAGTVLVRMLGS